MDIDPATSSGVRGQEKVLRFVLAPGPTPASATYASLLPQVGNYVRAWFLHYIIVNVGYVCDRQRCVQVLWLW